MTESIGSQRCATHWTAGGATFATSSKTRRRAVRPPVANHRPPDVEIGPLLGRRHLRPLRRPAACMWRSAGTPGAPARPRAERAMPVWDRVLAPAPGAQ
jgi:hypothetical protein